MMRHALALITVLSLSACGGARFAADESDQQRIQSDRANVMVVWSADIDQRRPMDPSGFSAPAVQTTSSTIVIGGRDGRVHIYSMGGSETDRVVVDDAVESGGLALDNGLVVVGDVGGKLYGIDPAAGQIVWQYQLSSALVGRPVALGDNLVLQTQDNRLYGVTASGEKLWSYAGSGGGGLGLYLSASPLVIDETVYAIFSNGDAVAVKATTGDLVWRRQLLLDSDASVLSELKAPIADPVRVDLLHMGMQRIENALIVGFYQGELLVLSRLDGTQLLAQPVSIKSSPVVTSGELFIADAEGTLQAINSLEGTILWSHKLSDGELVGPVLVNGQLWLADDRGSVFRVSRDGKQSSSITLPGRVDRLPVVLSEGVLVRTDRGVLYMLR